MYSYDTIFNEIKIKEICQNFTERKAACFTISCFGMFSFVGKDFLTQQPEIFSIWQRRGIPLGEDLFSVGFEKLARALESPTPYQSDDFFHKHYYDSYLNGDDGVHGDPQSFDARVGFFLNYPKDIAIVADALLSAADVTETVGILDRKFSGAYLSMVGFEHILSYALFNSSEPETLEAREEIKLSSLWERAKQDIQHAIDLANQEKFIPLGDRKWDYEFFGLSFQGSNQT